MSTPVIFRKFIKDSDEVIAMFPTTPATRNSWYCQSYTHQGQHGAASVELFYKDTRPATRDEYLPLLRELESAGYDDLRIYERYQPEFTMTRVGKILGLWEKSHG